MAIAGKTVIPEWMLVMDPDAVPVFEAGIMLYNVTIDGTPIRAGITLAAFEELMARAGYEADRDLGGVMVGDMLALLKLTIEAHLQSKHYRQGGSEHPLLIDVADLVTH